MNLIISALKKDDLYNKKIENIQKNINNVEIIYAEDMNIKGCIGCNRCWLVSVKYIVCCNVYVAVPLRMWNQG